MDLLYTIEQYATKRRAVPFGVWLQGLKDKRARAKLLARIRRASFGNFGNFGDWKKIAGVPGLCEMREHYGPGCRVYTASRAR